MRQIEFRGKRIDNGEWVYGYYCQDYILKNVVHIIQSGKIGTENYNEYEVDQSTIGQFTGLVDKMEKRIYEGDIICTPFIDPIFGDMIDNEIYYEQKMDGHI